MVQGYEFHSVIESIFEDVQNLYESEQVRVNCPVCEQRDGLSFPDGKFNLEINTNKKVFHCWKCDSPKFSGTLNKLVRKYGTNSDYELFRSMGGHIFSGEVSSSDEETLINAVLPYEFISFKDMNAYIPSHFEAYSYMTIERKISKDILHEFNIGFCNTGEYFNRIIIPSYDADGQLNYFIARSYKKKHKPPYMNPEVDKQLICFNENRINWNQTVYIVEGVFDMLSFPLNTIPQLGKVISKRVLSLLKQYKPNVVILFDPDAFKNMIETYQLIKNLYDDLESRVRFVKFEGKYDIDEIRVKYGINAVKEKLKQSRQMTVDDYFEI